MIQKFSKFDIDEKCDDGYFIVDFDDLISSIERKYLRRFVVLTTLSIFVVLLYLTTLLILLNC